jgi:DNA-directed RNA polymerase subunit RPC12/RpoP
VTCERLGRGPVLLLAGVLLAMWGCFAAAYFATSNPLFLYLMNGLSMAVGAWVIIWNVRRIRREKTGQDDRCPVCGYRLRGLPDRYRCPECGTPFDRTGIGGHNAPDEDQASR